MVDFSKSTRPVLTAECLPPLGADAAAVKKLAACLPTSLSAVVLPDNPDDVRGSALACAAVLAQQGLATVLTIATRDRNRIALQSEVLGASMLGVQGILCLGGDHQSLGACPAAAGAYDIDSIQFASALGKMGQDGTGLDGRKMPAPVRLDTGAVVHPYLRPMELNLIRLRKKLASGVKFVFTQAVFDLAGFGEWLSAVQKAGLAGKAAIIASVLPLVSVEQAKQLAAKRTYGPIGQDVIARLAGAKDAAAEGVAIAAEMAGKLAGMSGVRGIAERRLRGGRGEGD